MRCLSGVLQVLSLSLSSSSSSLASSCSGPGSSDMLTDTEREAAAAGAGRPAGEQCDSPAEWAAGSTGVSGTSMSVSTLLDSSAMDASLDLVDLSPMSGKTRDA